MKSNLLLSVIGICLFAACQPTPPPAQTSPASPAATAPDRDYFDVALDYLAKLDEFDPKQGMVQTAYYLNRWIEGSQEQVAWQLDPMLEELPAELRRFHPVSRWTSGSSRSMTCGTCASVLGSQHFEMGRPTAG